MVLRYEILEHLGENNFRTGMKEILKQIHKLDKTSRIFQTNKDAKKANELYEERQTISKLI